MIQKLRKKIKEKTQLEKEFSTLKKLENKSKRKGKIRKLKTSSTQKLNKANQKTRTFLGKIRQIFHIPRRLIYRFKARRDKRGIIIMDSGFINELKEKTKDQNHKGKWLKINPPNKEKGQIRKMKTERKSLVILMSKMREEKIKQNKTPDPSYNSKMKKYRAKLEKIMEELPFLEARLAKRQKEKSNKKQSKA